MPVHLINSPLLGDRVSTPEMRAIFEAHSQYQSWLDVEAALAEAQAEIGMIPAEAARAIRQAARIEQSRPGGGEGARPGHRAPAARDRARVCARMRARRMAPGRTTGRPRRTSSTAGTCCWRSGRIALIDAKIARHPDGRAAAAGEAPRYAGRGAHARRACAALYLRLQGGELAGGAGAQSRALAGCGRALPGRVDLRGGRDVCAVGQPRVRGAGQDVRAARARRAAHELAEPAGPRCGAG